MSLDSKIEWCDATWNVVRGCSLVSEGCRSCYAMKTAHRFSGPGATYEGLTRIGPNGPTWTGDVLLVPEKLDEPLRRKKPTTYFVNSMSDLFQEGVPDEYIDRVFAVMALAPRHTFQILTKRAERMRDAMTQLVSPTGYDRRLLALEAILDGDPFQRRVRVSGGSVRRAGDRHGWSDLAGDAEASGQLGEDIHAGAVRAGSRRGDERPLPSSEDHEGRRAPVRGGAPVGVASLSRTDPAGQDGEPYRRDHDQQQAGESRARDESGADGARVFSPRSPSRRAEGRVEQNDTPDGVRRSLDSESSGCRRESAGDSQGPQHQQRRGLSDRLSAVLETHPVAADWLRGSTLPNAWLGVSCENQHFADERIPLLLQTPAAVRFISAEPLLADVDLDIEWLAPFRETDTSLTRTPRLDWVIVGGESGPGARPFDVALARSIVAQCKAAGVSVFVKQLGANPTGDVDRVDVTEHSVYGPEVIRYTEPISLLSRKGGDMAEWPEDLRVREMPTVIR